MENIGEIIGILIFLIISLLASYLEKSKKKQAPKQQAPQRNSEKKKESPLDFFEKIIFEQETKPEPQVKMEPVIIKDEPLVITPPVSKYQANQTEKARMAYQQTIDINKTAKNIRGQLRNPQTVRELILVHEILGKPKAFQD